MNVYYLTLILAVASVSDVPAGLWSPCDLLLTASGSRVDIIDTSIAGGNAFDWSR